MRTMRLLLVGPLMLAIALSTPALASQDRHVIDPSAVAGAVTDHVVRQDADRATIHQALDRPEMRNVANRAGIDIERISASVDTLNGPGLSQAAAVAAQVNASLVGGASTIVISTSTIIIILLLVLLIVVVAR